MATTTTRELPLSADDLLRALLRLPASRRLSLLDSCGVGRPSPGLLIAGFDPFEVIEARGDLLRVTRRGGEEEPATTGDALSLLDERLSEYSQYAKAVSSRHPHLAGACIATISYDLADRIERRLREAKRIMGDEPDLVLAFYDTLLVHDYGSGVTEALSVAGPDRLDETAEALFEALDQSKRTEEEEGRVEALSLNSNFTRNEYLEAVGRIKEHIAAGDIYQANLTQRLSCELAPGSEPEAVFLNLRREHPAPFAAFIRRTDDVVVSASPERFLRVEASIEGRVVEAWPIKGTRPRGASASEDERLRLELMSSEKDRAENVMIVDLMRNDLGRVCLYGSVEVEELCALEEHPTLFHLVSRVRGRLRDDITPGSLLRATFPCGSITGAPKIRAMEIIAGAEPEPRGISMGAIGYFSFDGSVDLSVAIRTMVVRDSAARFNVGGGIVADSVPALEYDESLVKARALLKALGASGLA